MSEIYMHVFSIKYPCMKYMHVRNVCICTLFPDTHAIAHARAGTHTISLFVLVFLYIFRKEKFFIEGFFTKAYIQRIQNAIKCKTL